MKSLLLLSICMMDTAASAYGQQGERKREEIKSEGAKRLKKTKKVKKVDD